MAVMRYRQAFRDRPEARATAERQRLTKMQELGARLKPTVPGIAPVATTAQKERALLKRQYKQALPSISGLGGGIGGLQQPYSVRQDREEMMRERRGRGERLWWL